MGEIIRCSLCGHTSKTLKQHIEKEHTEIQLDQYVKLHGSYMAPLTRERKKKAGRKNGDWINRAQENGEDLSEYFKKMGKALSKSLMSNDAERSRRSELMSDMWKDADKEKIFRQNQSDTAKITSARPDIQAARSAGLKKWRDENPQEFYEKCTKVMHEKWTSEPERVLREFCQSLNPNFKGNQQIKSINHFFVNNTNSKQIDILDKSRKIILELDGPHHFLPIYGEETLIKNQMKDAELENYCRDKGYLFIRISHSEFRYSSKKFSTQLLGKVQKILENNNPGIYKIGKEYVKD